MRCAVVGHVEWVQFARVARVPRPGEIAHASIYFCEAAGGGAVAAVQLARLAGDCTLYTALGDDELGARARERLADLGVRVEAATRPDKPTRRAFTFLDDDGERTITTLGERLAPRAEDPLPWRELGAVDGVYFTAGDAEALRAARAAGTLVATTRAGEPLLTAGVALDAAVRSAKDPGERELAIEPSPHYVVATSGSAGGSWHDPAGLRGRWAPQPLPGPRADAYGAGDSFAAGLTYGLAEGRSIDAAVAVASRCGATCMTGRGPYEHQLSSAELDRPADGDGVQ